MAAGDIIYAADFPATVEADEAANEADISSTTFTAGAVQCAVTFVAATSGKAIVHIFADFRSNDTNHIIVSFEIRETDASGAEVVPADDENAVSTVTTQQMRVGCSKLVTGLTPGATYFARTMHRVTAGSVQDVLHRRIIVQPTT